MRQSSTRQRTEPGARANDEERDYVAVPERPHSTRSSSWLSSSFGESMNDHTENQSWVVNRGGQVIEKKAQKGLTGLNEWERLVYCLWVTDYMMRNAGDLANAVDMYPNFRQDAQKFAKDLSLPLTCEAFSLSKRKLQSEYFNRFEAICDEIRNAEPAA